MDEGNNTQTTTTEGVNNTTQANQNTNQSAEGNANTSNNDGAKTFTQAEVDALIEKRLARERKKQGQQNAQTSNAAQGTVATTTEPAVQTVEVDVTEDARQQAAVIIAQANQRLIQAVALSEAAKLNINPDYLADAVKLADLGTVKVNDDGTVDSKSVATALEAVVKRMPVLKAATQAPAGGFKVGGQGNNNQQSSVWGSNSAKNSGETKRWNKNRY